MIPSDSAVADRVVDVRYRSKGKMKFVVEPKIKAVQFMTYIKH